ncbi:SRPBCC family protein [Meiothermus sp.]|uniref:SRPBCC family protein n=1 Tax=Meiothermus sp. TaxID=1955249 RepID=UPI002612E0C4|nr:SRPBCC family protein [Meiothermus sp.]
MERSLESTWVLRAPLAPVWAALADLLGWPRWWLGLQSAQVVQPGQANGVKAVYRLNGQELRVCEVRPLEWLEVHTESVLARCTLEHEEGHTFVHWSVWGYPDEARFAQAMQAGARGLAAHLGVLLLEVGSWNAANDQSIFP